MALISNNISGSASNSSRIGITGSVIISNTPGATFPDFPGSDTVFFVSGSSSAKSVFGGDLMVSGALNASGAIEMRSGGTLSGTFVFDASGLEVSGTLYAWSGSIDDFQFVIANNNSSQATGISAFAIGRETTASGMYSFSHGKNSVASGEYSNAGGEGTQATHTGSHTEGYYTIASGQASYARGFRTTATNIGAASEGLFTTGSGLYSHAEGAYSISSGSYTHAEGQYTLALGYGSHTEGSYTTASGSYSHAEGDGTISSGSYSHAEGSGSISLGNYSHAEGTGNVATGYGSHAEGSGSVAWGTLSHAEGTLTIASGTTSHTEGQSTVTYGYGAHAEGLGTIASGNYSHTEGQYTIASGSYQTVVGKYNSQQNATSLFVVGDGTNSGAGRHDVFRVETGAVQVTGSLDVTGSLKVSNDTNVGLVVENISASVGGTGTTTFSLLNQSIFYVNGPAGNITANFTNVPTTVDRVISTTVILSQSATPRIVSAVQINGSAQTLNWINNTEPTGTANKHDVFGFSLIRSGSTPVWVVLGQMSTFG